MNKLDDTEIQKIIMLRNQKKSIRNIAKETKHSVHTILKYINNPVADNNESVADGVADVKKNNVELKNLNDIANGVAHNVADVADNRTLSNRIENLEKAVVELKNEVEKLKNEIIYYIYNNKEKKITTKKINNTTKNNIPECSSNSSLSNNISLKDKEEIKEINNKEKKENNNKTNSYFLLVKNFANLIGVSPDKGFINKNIKHAKNLLSQYTEEEVFNIIKWRLDNDKDGFYHKKLTNLGFVYSHIAEWIKLKNDKKITFDEFVKQNPDLDFENEDDAVVRFEKYFKVFKLAKNNPLVELTQDDWDRYKRAIKNYGKIFKKIKEGYYDEENY